MTNLLLQPDMLRGSSVLLAFWDSPSVKPLWRPAVMLVVGLALIALIYRAIRTVAPKIGAVAWATTKEAISQPFFYLVIFGGLAAVFLIFFIPYFTFGEDVKVFEECGLTLVMVAAILMALWTASTTLADEIEGRTALTVLSKPVSRRDFILGKFVGVLGATAVLYIVLGSYFIAWIPYKVVYDARETAAVEPNSEKCAEEMMRMLPGLALGFMETTVMTSITIAISTRLSMLPNLVISLTIYVLGHLVPLLAKSAVGQVAMVPFFADFLAAVLPVLDHFNIYGPIATGDPVPPIYLLYAFGYCVLYSTVAMLVALLLFEDRDLA